MQTNNQKIAEAIIGYERLNNCPYCKSDSLRMILKTKDRLTDRQGVFYLAKCDKCGFNFQNPRVKEEYIGSFYNDKLGYYQLPKDYNNRFVGFKGNLKKTALINHFNYSKLGKKNLFKWLVSRPVARKLKNELFPNFVKNGKILEIGCGNGVRLYQLLELGWNVSGEDMNEELADKVREMTGIKINSQSVEDLIFSEKEFDALVMNMVLEHLYNPFLNLKKITGWLKPGGELLFSIPYIHGLEAKIYKEYFYGLQLPTHISFFSKKIIKDYLQQLGYENIKFYNHFFDRDFVASAQWRYKEKSNWFDKLIGYNKYVRLFFIKPLVIILGWLGFSSRLSVIAIKKDV